MKHSPSKSITSVVWQQFLDLPSHARAARLIEPSLIPRPLDAVLAEGRLTWKWYDFNVHGGSRQAPRSQPAPAKLCFAFAQLAQAPDEQIRRFAKRWGPLDFHPLGQRQEESLEAWRHYARLAQALMRYTAMLQSGGAGEEEDWDVIRKFTPAKDLDRKGLNEETQMAIVASAANLWFSAAPSHGILTMLDRELEVRPHASTLFGVLITQIAHVIARSDQTALCAGCRNPFRRDRPITRGVRNYCKSCRKAKVPQRDASRDWRRRTLDNDPDLDQTAPQINSEPEINSEIQLPDLSRDASSPELTIVVAPTIHVDAPFVTKP
jgi:hypothetical protein